MRRVKLKKCKRVHSLRFTPDGGRLVALGGYEVRGVDTAIHVDPQTGAEVARLDVMAWCAAVAPDPARVAAGNPYPDPGGLPVRWIDTNSTGGWHPLPVECSTEDEILGLAFGPDGSWLAVGGTRHYSSGARGLDRVEYRVALWQLDPPAESGEFRVAAGPNVMAVSPDGTRLALSGGIDGNRQVYVYDLTTGKRAWEFRPTEMRTRVLVFDSSGRLAVVNGRTVLLLPPDGGDPLFLLGGQTKQVNAVAFSPDGRHLLSASHDGAIRIWDAATGEPVKSFDWQIGPVTAVAFAPDGLTCAAGGLDGQVVVWDVDA